MQAAHQARNYYGVEIPYSYSAACALNGLRILRVDAASFNRHDFRALIQSSQVEGFKNLQRLEERWRGGANLLSAHGEALFAAEYQGRIIGTSARMIDPADSEALELCYGYVLPEYRQLGVGSALLAANVRDIPDGDFRRITMRARYHIARSFIKNAGFMPLA